MTLCWLVLLLLLLVGAGCALVAQGLALSPLYPGRSRYYYPSYEAKMNETLVGCAYQILSPIDHRAATSLDLPSASSANGTSVFLIPSPIAADLVQWYLSLPRPKQMRVSPDLCSIPFTYRRPIFNNTGCQLRHYMSLYAPRCQTQQLQQICAQAQQALTNATRTGYVLPEADHSLLRSSLPPQPYLLAVRDAYATMCGQASLPCGTYHPSTNCHTTGYKVQIARFHRQCTARHAARTPEAPEFQCAPGTPFSNLVTREERVFVVAQVDDTYTYHIHLEIVPRLVYYLAFLRANPDVKILYGCDVKNSKAQTAQGLAKGLQSLQGMLDFFNLTNSLLVQKHVHSRNVLYFPMEGACQDPVYNTWHVLYMRRWVLDRLRGEYGQKLSVAYKQYLATKKNLPDGISVHDNNQRDPSKSNLVLLKRSSNSKFTRNNADLVRQWDNAFTQRLLQELGSFFGHQYNILLLSDQDEFYMNCYACQVQLLSTAKVLIGMHGAGLGLMLYMPPNGAVIEIAPYANDGRCLLGAGPFSREATVLSHNYLIHYPRYAEFKWQNRGKTAQFNVTRFAVHTQSFLQSIDFL